MADDTRENAASSAATPFLGTAAAEPLKKFPKGVVLGKDGKP